MTDEDYWLASTAGDKEPGINGAIMRRIGPRPEIGAPVVGAVITVQVEDLDAAIEKARALGADIALETMQIPGVGSVAYLHETEANVLGVFQPLG